MAKEKELETKPFRLKPGRKFHVPRTDGVAGTRKLKAGSIVELTPNQQMAFKDAFEPVDKKPAPKVVDEVEDDEEEVDDETTEDDDEEVIDDDEDGDAEDEEETPKQKRARLKEEKKAAKASKKKK